MNTPLQTAPVSIDDVRAAATRLVPVAVRTPVLPAPALGQVVLKCENLQRTGSFKFRGAYNKIKSALEGSARVPGVVAFSSGNHAQGVAAAATQLGVPSIIVMPEDAPRIKIENTRALGAEVRLYDRYREDREAIARAIARDKGYLVVPPYDDPMIIAGQGTIGLEIAEDCARLGVTPDVVLAPCSGGGLISGIATAVKTRHPQARVFACEPARFDDTARSLAAGQRLENAGNEKSICDALLSKSPGEITFPINRRLLSGGLTANDEEALAAVAFAVRRLKLVVEPGGAVALAAILAGRYSLRGKTAVVVCSGGNADPKLFAEIIREAA